MSRLSGKIRKEVLLRPLSAVRQLIAASNRVAIGPAAAHHAETVDTTHQQDSTNHEPPSSDYRDTLEMSEHFLAIAKEASEATELLSPLKSACALMLRGIQEMRDMHNNTQAWADLCDELAFQLSQLEQYRDEIQQKFGDADEGCLSALEFYLRTIAEVVRIAQLYSPENSSSSKSVKRTVLAQGETEDIGRQRQRLTSAWRLYSDSMTRYLSQRIDRIEGQFEALVARSAEIAEMGPVRREFDNYDGVEGKYALAYGERVELCEDGTRTGVITTIKDWANDCETTKQIFWLNDAAGTGKSTIAATLAREWHRSGCLTGRFFFSPDSVVTKTTSEFCIAVAQDIITNQPGIQEIVQAAIEATPLDRHFWFDIQLRRLIIEPLQSLPHMSRVLLVVDALDNCTSQDEREELINCFTKHLPSIPQLKVLLTSRPLQDIAVLLQECPLVYGSEIQLLNVNDASHPDIVTYVEKRLEDVSEISPEHRHTIVAKSGGLFLFAATVCRMLERSRTRKVILDIILEIGSTTAMEKKMDRLYLSVLRQASVDDEAHHFLMAVLSTIIIAYQPISINTISTFLPHDIQVDLFVQDLSGVLKDGHPDRPIKVLHPTFREFILSNYDRANGFLVNPMSSSTTVAASCINTLERMLVYDMLGLNSPKQLPIRNSDFIGNIETLVGRCTTAAERYASAFWAYHVASSDVSQEMWSIILTFISRKLLNWVELMSWRGDINSCIEGLSKLRMKALDCHSIAPESLSRSDLQVIRHAHQFVVRHQSLISEAALQTYSVALFFTPLHSSIFQEYRSMYRSHQPLIRTLYTTYWGSNTTMEGHTDHIRELVLSPDGSRLISAGRDARLCLWNIQTGALVGNPFQSDVLFEPTIRSVGPCIFSSDGKSFAFSVITQELHICHSYSGESILPPESSIKLHMAHFACTPTLSQVVTASGRSIWTWDMESRKTVEAPDTLTQDFGVCDIVVSPDGTKVVHVGETFPGRRHRAFLWELSSFREIFSYPMKGTPDFQFWDSDYIAFSQDGTRYATWVGAGPIYLRDSRTGQEIALLADPPLNGRYGSMNVIFDPHSRHVAYGCLRSFDLVIVREQATGRKISTFRHQDIIYMSFSSDGERIASVSRGQMVCVWDVTTGEPLESIFKGPAQNIYRCILSPSWDKLVTVLEGHQINLYDLSQQEDAEATETNDPRPLSKLQEHKPAILAGSYTGSKAALRDGLRSVALWDTETGTTSGNISTERIILQVAFSPNGGALAMLFGDHPISVWDADTCSSVTELTRLCDVGDLYGEGVLFFSPDSALLAASLSGFTRIWDMNTKSVVWWYDKPRQEPGVETWLCCISSDNRKVATSEVTNQIYVWSLPSNGEKIVIDSTRKFPITFGAFSPKDSTLLALGNPREIQLWRIGEEPNLVAELNFAVFFSGRFSFSADGKFIAYGSKCWLVDNLPLVPYSGSHPPESFGRMGLNTHSFLTYSDGWIHSTFPPTPLLPLPTELRSFDLNRQWYAYDECVILLSSRGEPFLIDCRPLIARARLSRTNVETLA